MELIKKLIEFAEENDYFEFEFEEDEEERKYRQLWTVADQLYEELSSAEETGEGATVVGTGEAPMEQSITSQHGKAWWNISSVKLGLNPDQLRKWVQELRDRLRPLIFYSDSLEVRQAILEAVYALQSTERYFTIQSSIVRRSQIDERRNMQGPIYHQRLNTLFQNST